jgi:hypothetical protein
MSESVSLEMHSTKIPSHDDDHIHSIGSTHLTKYAHTRSCLAIIIQRLYDGSLGCSDTVGRAIVSCFVKIRILEESLHK